VARQAYKTQQRIDSGDLTKIGVNLFPEEEGAAERRDYYKADPEVLARQTAKLHALKKSRDSGRVERALEEVRRIARMPSGPESNLLEPVLEAARAYATVGEIRSALQDVFGEYRLPRAI
jgi:methylmalonyl-CoA mutase